ncbi:response regulator [bacterium]|nr:response regulator [bacterium]
MKKILLIEDDPLLLDIYTTKLKQEGFEVVVATDGDKALDIVKKENPDLVLLDIVLPNKDGWEILKKIKQEKKSSKVIILSNLGQKEEVEKGIQLGAEKYLIKANFTPSQVVEEIKKVI